MNSRALNGQISDRERKYSLSKEGADSLRVFQVVSASSAGGTERIASSLSQSLKSRGHTVAMASPKPGWLTESLLGSGIELLYMRMSGPNRYAAALRIAGYVKRHRFEIIHSHLARATKVGHLVSLLTGKPLIASSHSMRFDPVFKRVAHARNKVAAVSRHVQVGLLENGVPEKSIQLIYNGTDFSELPFSAPDSVYDQFAIPRDRVLIGMIGRVQRSKGCYDLIEAASRLKSAFPNVHLIFVGPSSERKQRQIDGFVRAYNMEDRVTFAGAQGDVARFMDAYAIHAVPSHFEAFGLSAIEAMVRGKPVIAYETGGLSEVVQHGVNGLLIEPGIQNLANALRDLLSNPAKGLEMGERGKLFVRDMFPLSRMVEGYENAYLAALKTQIAPKQAAVAEAQITSS